MNMSLKNLKPFPICIIAIVLSTHWVFAAQQQINTFYKLSDASDELVGCIAYGTINNFTVVYRHTSDGTCHFQQVNKMTGQPDGAPLVLSGYNVKTAIAFKPADFESGSWIAFYDDDTDKIYAWSPGATPGSTPLAFDGTFSLVTDFELGGSGELYALQKEGKITKLTSLTATPVTIHTAPANSGAQFEGFCLGTDGRFYVCDSGRDKVYSPEPTGEDVILAESEIANSWHRRTIFDAELTINMHYRYKNSETIGYGLDAPKGEAMEGLFHELTHLTAPFSDHGEAGNPFRNAQELDELWSRDFETLSTVYGARKGIFPCRD